MKPKDEVRQQGKSPPQKAADGHSERADLVVAVTRTKQRCKKAPVVSAETIASAFNTWAFKREQPDSREKLLAQIDKAIVLSQPVRFVLYWGKGPRNDAGPKEIACIDYMGQMIARIREVYQPGAQITLVFTDTHAQLNGHKVIDYTTYFSAVRALLPSSGYDTCHLASIVRDARPLIGDFDPTGEPLDEHLLGALVNSAQKWYRGGATAREGAIAYYRANLVERRAMELSFPDSIFVTFNSSELRPLFPENLPIFYMYSLRKGIAVKPWFLA